jgi:hypothetical protein
VAPLLAKYCTKCHGGAKPKADLALDKYASGGAAVEDEQTWQRVLEMLDDRLMPPDDEPQPSDEELQMVVGWIREAALGFDCAAAKRPGRVTLRRLNRAEYNNTIRDLMGVDFQPADDFPSDDVGYGFDNIGDVLSLSPLLFEKYLAAAEKIVARAVALPAVDSQRFAGDQLSGGESAEEARALYSNGEVSVELSFPVDGEYVIRAEAFAQQAGPDPASMELRLDGEPIKAVGVTALRDAPEVYETRTTVTAGKHRVAAAFVNDYYKPNDPDPEQRDRNLFIRRLDVQPPTLTVERYPEPYRRIFVCGHADDAHTAECAREILRRFAARAYRRPVTDDELARLVALVEAAQADGDSFEQAVGYAIQAVLVSPHFLFRIELDPPADDEDGIRELSDYELATRLSYFLWSSMPDDALFHSAEQGKLHEPKVLEAQVRRMLADTKSQALVENFAGQWLQLRNLDIAQPDRERFPDYDDALRDAMRRESELFFQNVMREDRSVLEFLDADYTFVNHRLAEHYGLALADADGAEKAAGADAKNGGDVAEDAEKVDTPDAAEKTAPDKADSGGEGSQSEAPEADDVFQRVTLPDKRRGGVLTQASVLMITSHPTRTSPVKRGKWILENILGTPPPPPPPGVPPLSEAKSAEESATLRQRMEIHRSNPNCAVCHEQMDALGFGFENYDATGAWRERDGEFPIDASGTLPGEQSFNGPADLKMLLMAEKDLFSRCLAEKMLTYALGRGLEAYDKCTVEEIVAAMKKDDYRFSSLVLGIVKSDPFRMRSKPGESESNE